MLDYNGVFMPSDINADTLFKVLGEGGRCMWGGNGYWHLPEDGNPGKWMRPIKWIEPCHSGYHLCEGVKDLVHWIEAHVYTAEGAGHSIRDENKGVYSEARLLRRVDAWNFKTASLFLCDLAGIQMLLEDLFGYSQDMKSLWTIQNFILKEQGINYTHLALLSPRMQSSSLIGDDVLYYIEQGHMGWLTACIRIKIQRFYETAQSHILMPAVEEALLNYLVFDAPSAVIRSRALLLNLKEKLRVYLRS